MCCHRQQLQSGQDYDCLKPTYGIWLLAENLMPNDAGYTHHYKLRDERGRVLLEHGGIWLLEIEKLAAERVENEEQRWLKLFREGERIDEAALPYWMNTDEMRQAMSTLEQFSEKERNYHAYQARQNFLREQRALAKEREEAEREREQAEREREQERLAREQAERALAEERVKNAAALAEIERLKALLEQR